MQLFNTNKRRSGQGIVAGTLRVPSRSNENDTSTLYQLRHTECAYYKAFTLVELLVVIAIIGILVALLLPAIQSARESARRTICTNNMKTVGLAAQNYASQYPVFPGSWVNGSESVTWGRSLLPFIERQALWDAWDRQIGFLAGANGKLAAEIISDYKCPTAISPAVYEYQQSGYPLRYATTDYKGCQGANGNDPAVAHWSRKEWIPGVVSRERIGPRQITDGLSSTILLVESTGGKDLYGPGGEPWFRSTIWYATDGAWVGRAMSSVSPVNYGERWGMGVCGVNCSNMYDYGPYSFHPGGANSVLCDGSVHFLPEDIDPAILCGLYAYADGDLVHLD